MEFSQITVAVQKIITETKVQLVDELQTFITDKLDEDSTEAIVELFKEFKLKLANRAADDMKKVHVKGKRAPKAADGEKKTKKPSEYNMFVGTKIKELRAADSTLNGRDAMKKAIGLWKEFKEARSHSEGEKEEEKKVEKPKKKAEKDEKKVEKKATKKTEKKPEPESDDDEPEKEESDSESETD